jgi:hypothetical protein
MRLSNKSSMSVSNRFYGHLVLSNGTCFIEAYNVNRTQVFDDPGLLRYNTQFTHLPGTQGHK